MPEPTFAMEVAKEALVDLDGVRSRLHTFHNPRAKDVRHSKVIKSKPEKAPRDGVISLGKINVEEASLGLSSEEVLLEQLLDKEDVVTHQSPCHKGTLSRINDLAKHSSKPHGHDFGDDFVGDVATSNGPVVLHLGRVVHLRH